MAGAAADEGAPTQTRPISLDDVDLVLRHVIRHSWRWTALAIAAATLSAFKLSFKSGNVEVAVEITAITVALIALIWLPALINVIAIAGGGVKTPAGEVAAGGLLDLLRSLEPAAQRGALPAVIAALDTGATRGDPRVARLREQLQGDLAGLPVTSTDARAKLDFLAREYENVRATMPGGPDRTFKMTQVVSEAKGLANAAGVDLDSLVERFDNARDGERIVALAIAQAKPDARFLPIVVGAISAGAIAVRAVQRAGRGVRSEGSPSA